MLLELARMKHTSHFWAIGQPSASLLEAKASTIQPKVMRLGSTFWAFISFQVAQTPSKSCHDAPKVWHAVLINAISSDDGSHGVSTANLHQAALLSTLKRLGFLEVPPVAMFFSRWATLDRFALPRWFTKCRVLPIFSSGVYVLASTSGTDAKGPQVANTPWNDRKVYSTSRNSSSRSFCTYFKSCFTWQRLLKSS